MHNNPFVDIKDIAQVISSHNQKFSFLATVQFLKPVISIMPHELKSILSSKEVICDIFHYSTNTTDARRCKFRIKTSNSGYAQILRMSSNKKAIYQAIKLYLKLCPNDENIKLLLKRDRYLELSPQNTLSQSDFIEHALIINHSHTLENILLKKHKEKLKRTKITRANQPKGDFKIISCNKEHKKWLALIKQTIKNRYLQIQQIDEERAKL